MRGESAKQHAMEALRVAISRGDVVPGQRLVEAELAESFGVTRASIRAALLELTSEGLVERVPNKGARVRQVSLDEAISITECRQALEGLCAAKAAEFATDEERARLSDLGASLRQAVADGEPLKYSDLNRDLHAELRRMARQPVAAELLERLHAQLVRYQFRLALTPGRVQTSLGEHLAIVDAVVAGDPVAAEAAIRRHLASVIVALRAQAEQG